MIAQNRVRLRATRQALQEGGQGRDVVVDVDEVARVAQQIMRHTGDEIRHLPRQVRAGVHVEITQMQHAQPVQIPRQAGDGDLVLGEVHARRRQDVLEQGDAGAG